MITRDFFHGAPEVDLDVFASVDGGRTLVPLSLVITDRNIILSARPEEGQKPIPGSLALIGAIDRWSHQQRNHIDLSPEEVSDPEEIVFNI